MNTYYVWITAMFETYADALIAELVKNRFEVKSLADSGTVALTSNSNSLIALQLKSALDDVSKVKDELKKALEKTKALYYSLIVSTPAACTWVSGNIKIPEPAPAPSKPIDILN